jgi:hypothetical protein
MSKIGTEVVRSWRSLDHNNIYKMVDCISFRGNVNQVSVKGEIDFMGGNTAAWFVKPGLKDIGVVQ